MKQLIIALVALFSVSVSTSAMSYEQAREQALFLTDKMAYELNLTEAQYEAAYEVNLDYLMGVNGYDDVYGTYWTRRNLDLSYILLDWQYQAFVNATYFYRPLWWEGGYWHFGIYARYPHRDYFYFGRPGFYASYRGGHSWHMNGGRSWYNGRRFDGPGPQGGRQNGMRDGFQRGDYRGGNRSFGNATRQTTQRPATTYGNQQRQGGVAQQRQGATFGNQTRQSNTTFGNQQRQGNSSFGTQQRQGTTQRQSSGSFGTQQRQSTSSFGGHRSTTDRQSSTRTTVTRPQTSGSSFGGASRSMSQPRQSFSPSRSGGGSFGGHR